MKNKKIFYCCYLFYIDYLVTAIQQSYFKSRRIGEKQAENIEEINFDVVNNKVKLVD